MWWTGRGCSGWQRGSADTGVGGTVPGENGSVWQEAPFHRTLALGVPKQPCHGARQKIEARRVTSPSLPRSSGHRKSTGGAALRGRRAMAESRPGATAVILVQQCSGVGVVK